MCDNLLALATFAFYYEPCVQVHLYIYLYIPAVYIMYYVRMCYDMSVKVCNPIYHDVGIPQSNIPLYKFMYKSYII